MRTEMARDWAWHRARELALRDGVDFVPDLLLDFVDRREVVYAWSQFTAERNGGETADLPGSDALGVEMSGGGYAFGGTAWKTFREKRRYSTALSAPVNYGPALKALRLVRAHPTVPSVMEAAPFTLPALKAFEDCIADCLGHPAFSRLGPVDVTADEFANGERGGASAPRPPPSAGR
jgi:hypothetical protein